MNSDTASTIVVINGLAITAGSNPSLFARIGSEQPTSFAITTVQRIVRLITSATRMVTRR